ncbi:pyridoxamine 5'-phosphate oxidase family protein [Pseudomonas sp. MM211]|uniref:2Fe-2S iron-sulfur cluster-binding protein n=1 Tax=Pseudomonas sp. MM211 TaxID=2866808 RepID=UPI001CEDD1A4|nr:pyridoxamine 5'-phosphate oxidase family protein [Pseudomonas sp. MM211]UCJ14641.1 pyridoxamine 5'-phosphate oxidase family protein [Pseudomonas sp. MM211]
MTDHAKTPATWHPGETLIQEKLGVAERMAAVGKRVVRDFMPDQHREFYAQLPFMVLGSVDAQGDAWAGMLEGQVGFIASPTPATLDIAARPHPDDPIAQGMGDGAALGLLGIELHTRRRNRINGLVTAGAQGLRVAVKESFGNCPRYIQQRDFTFSRDPAAPFASEVKELPVLDAAARTLIEGADTFFVATYTDVDGQRQVDVSHRGGNSGFVRIEADGTLTIPDFNGNLFFSTLGNILLNGKAGLLFVDFATGDVLQMSGDAEVIFESPEIAAFQGAERLWTFQARRIVRRPGAVALRWALREDGWSDSSLLTGNWQQAADQLRAAQYATQWRPMKIARIVQESQSIRSLHLEPVDGAGLLPHLAGQHLPVRLQVAADEKPLIRTYTLSVAPSDGLYRISVKREGRVSQFIHDQLREGDLIDARAPAGAFTLDPPDDRPLVLLAGGIGITPMLAMLRHVVYEGWRQQRIRPVTLFYAARSKAERAFDRELTDLVAAAQGAVRLVRVLGDTQGAEPGIDYETAGRIDMALLTRFLAFDDYDFYLCGPPAFTQGLYDGLRGYNIADRRIHAEGFGPASLLRSLDQPATATAMLPPATEPVAVLFTESLKEGRWTPESGTLLELAEARGLEPEFSCREGTCGTCRTRLLKGAVSYVKQPTAKLDDNEVLICCAVPAQSQETGGERLELAL